MNLERHCIQCWFTDSMQTTQILMQSKHEGQEGSCLARRNCKIPPFFPLRLIPLNFFGKHN